MTILLKPGVIIASALATIALCGCVTEEVGPTNFHTTAYIERDDPDNTPAPVELPPAPIATDANSNGQSHH